MCAVIGALIEPGADVKRVNSILEDIWLKSHERGRDGRGYTVRHDNEFYLWRSTERYNGNPGMIRFITDEQDALIGNVRAEPTTEYVQDKEESDQQPYVLNDWAIVHNGTIANDGELRNWTLPTEIDSAAIAECLDQQPTNPFPSDVFGDAVRELKGSYAILAMHKRTKNIYYACNYRPLWYVIIPGLGAFIASARHYLPAKHSPRMLPPYTMGAFTRSLQGKVTLHVAKELRAARKSPQQALVVCSGGLDSVVAAVYAQAILGMKITLLHFAYGSRASGPEYEAIHKISKHFNCELITQVISVYRKEDSPLLRNDSTIAGGEAGAEFAYEWVPARNLLMLSMATAIAEARGIEHIVLGNNLEEAGAYPDNEPEFISRFNDMLPFAVGDGKRVEVLMPVGNMMKHEIVALGLELGAPLHLTWSCYKALFVNPNRGTGYIHCGKCGPCFMRRTAFRINNKPEVITYADEV